MEHVPEGSAFLRTWLRTSRNSLCWSISIAVCSWIQTRGRARTSHRHQHGAVAPQGSVPTLEPCGSAPRVYVCTHSHIRTEPHRLRGGKRISRCFRVSSQHVTFICKVSTQQGKSEKIWDVNSGARGWRGPAGWCEGESPLTLTREPSPGPDKTQPHTIPQGWAPRGEPKGKWPNTTERTEPLNGREDGRGTHRDKLWVRALHSCTAGGSSRVKAALATSAAGVGP